MKKMKNLNYFLLNNIIDDKKTDKLKLLKL